jgi:hypothetical protein
MADEPPAQASVGLSALTAFSWPSGGSLAGEATWLQDWPFQCSMKLALEFCPTAQPELNVLCGIADYSTQSGHRSPSTSKSR